MLFLNDVLNEDELFLIFSETDRKNPHYSYWEYKSVEKQVEEMSAAQFKSEFRFDYSEMLLLSKPLRIPERFTCGNETVASGEEGLLMLLKRFAYPCCLSDMMPQFGCSVPEMSLIFA